MAEVTDEKKQIAKIVESITVKAIARLSLAAVIPISLWGLNLLKNSYDEILQLRTQVALQSKDPYTGSDARKDIGNILTLVSRNQTDIAAIAARQAKDEAFMYQHTRP